MDATNKERDLEGYFLNFPMMKETMFTDEQ